MTSAMPANTISNDNVSYVWQKTHEQISEISGLIFSDNKQSRKDKMSEFGRDQIQDMIAASEARADTKFERLMGDMRETAARQDARFDVLLQRADATNARLSEFRDDVKNDGRSTRANLWAGIAILAGVIIGVASLMAAIAPAAFTVGTYVRDSVKSEIKDQQQATEAAIQKSIDAAIQKAFKEARAAEPKKPAPVNPQ